MWELARNQRSRECGSAYQDGDRCECKNNGSAAAPSGTTSVPHIMISVTVACLLQTVIKMYLRIAMSHRNGTSAYWRQHKWVEKSSFCRVVPLPPKKRSRNRASSHVLEYRVQHYCYHYSYPLNLIQVPHLERAAWLCPGPVAAIGVSAVCNLAFLNRICADGDFPVPGPWHVVPTA